MKTNQILLIIPLFFLLSCSSNKMNFSDNTININSKNFDLLKGKYSVDNINDGIFLNKLKNIKLSTTDKYSVELIPKDSKSILFNIFRSDTLIHRYKLKGNYRSGYFCTKKQTIVESVFAGPLFWAIGRKPNYFGLTNKNNLLVISPSGLGIMFFVALPVYIGGGEEIKQIFNRK